MSKSPPPYSVLGGCTTRDAGELGSNPLPKPVHYFSRTRIQSIVSTPSPIDETSIPLESNYQRRVIVEDHDKSVAKSLAGIDHALVLDLVGERSPLMHTGHGIITASQYYNAAGLNELPGAEPVPEDRELADGGPFSVAAKAFAALLPQQPVIIHRAFWATVDVNGDSLRKLPLAEKSNKWLTRAYEILTDALGERALPVEVSEALRVADPGHRWGAAPFHFPDAYYDELSAQIRERLGTSLPTAVAPPRLGV